MENLLIKDLLKKEPYSLNIKNKKTFFLKQLQKLNKHHYKNSINYRKIINKLNVDIENTGSMHRTRAFVLHSSLAEGSCGCKYQSMPMRASSVQTSC